MPTKSENIGFGAAIKSEGNGDYSRDAIILASGNGILLPGTVLGKITASGKYKQYTPGAADGTQNAVAVLYGYHDTTSADQNATGCFRVAEVWTARLQWGAAVVNQGQKDTAVAALLALGVVARA
jgi:Bacteriophage lambda head decoration protein D